MTIFQTSRIFLAWFWPLSRREWFRLKIRCNNVLISRLCRFRSRFFQSFRQKYGWLLKRFLFLNFGKIFILVIVVIIKVASSWIKPRWWVFNHFNGRGIGAVECFMVIVTIVIVITLIVTLFWRNNIFLNSTMIWLLFIT